MNLPARLAPYATLFACAGAHHGVEPLLIAAVMDRESEGGEAPGYHPKGPAGTGDWTARRGHWLHSPHVRVVTELPPGWHPPRDDEGNVLPGPYAIPADGMGWGRGLMQHDYERALLFDWRDPATNIDEGAKLLAELLAEFPRARSSAIAAYNCGAGNVRKAILLGHDCDHFTTGRNYSADVLRRLAAFAQESAA